jgi:hypothetical protein
MVSLFHHSIKRFFSAIDAAKQFTPRRASMFQQSSCIACHLTLCLLDLARSLERCAILFGTDCLSCFHSSASASQYFISEYSISFLASAACSRHMASSAENCFLEYIHFPVVTQSTHLLIEANLRCCNPDLIRRVCFRMCSVELSWSCSDLSALHFAK